MILTLRNGFSLILAIIFFLACRVTKPTSIECKYVLPTFDGYSIVRFPEKQIEAKFYGDYIFYKPTTVGYKKFKNDFNFKIQKPYSLLLWGQTNIPQFYSFYIIESKNNPFDVPYFIQLRSLTDSFYINNSKVFEYVIENNKSDDIFIQYVVHSSKYYAFFLKLIISLLMLATKCPQ